MICVFCGIETKTDEKWHLDCLDTIIENQFGKDMYDLLLEQTTTQRTDIPQWVERLIIEGVESGRRHKARFKIYTSLFSHRVSAEDIKEKIHEFNKNCRPPELEREVDYHIRYLQRRFFNQ